MESPKKEISTKRETRRRETSKRRTPEKEERKRETPEKETRKKESRRPDVRSRDRDETKVREKTNTDSRKLRRDDSRAKEKEDKKKERAEELARKIERDDRRRRKEKDERKKEEMEQKILDEEKRKREEEKRKRDEERRIKEAETKKPSSAISSKIEPAPPWIEEDPSEISEENIRKPSTRSSSGRKHIESPPAEPEEDFNYEDDDFEDYDDDFEDSAEDDHEEDDDEESEDESEEEPVEKKLDSGNYDMLPRRSDRQAREMAEVKAAMERENTARAAARERGGTDGGGVTRGVADPRDSGRERSPPPVRKQSGFINFSAAATRQKSEQAARAAGSRGSELLRMIRLDIVTTDLLDLPPIRYTLQRQREGFEISMSINVVLDQQVIIYLIFILFYTYQSAAYNVYI